MVFIDSLHNIFFENNDKYDVYLFYDHPRFLTNILYDISKLFRFSLITFWLININRKIFIPLFILSLLIWVSYFLTYNQITSLFVLPIYLIIAIYYVKKNKIKILFKRLLKWAT
jgi:hypothetical protein